MEGEWLVEDDYGLSETHPSIADAVNVILQRDLLLSGGDNTIVTEIRWKNESGRSQSFVRIIDGDII